MLIQNCRTKELNLSSNYNGILEMAAISHKMTRPSEQFDNFIKQRNFFVTSSVTKKDRVFVPSNFL